MPVTSLASFWEEVATAKAENGEEITLGMAIGGAAFYAFRKGYPTLVVPTRAVLDKLAQAAFAAECVPRGS
jgi:hypothetical protein